MPDSPAHSATRMQRAVKWTIFLSATGIVVYFCLLILRPFLNIIAWSCVLAIAFHPVHQRIVRRTGRLTLSALISSVLVVVAILIPLLVIGGLVLNQLLALRDYLQERFKDGFDLTTVESLRPTSQWVALRFGLELTDVAAWIAHSDEFGRLIAERSLAIAANVTGGVVSFVFTMFAMLLLFRDGERIVGKIPDLFRSNGSRVRPWSFVFGTSSMRASMV